MTRPRRKAITCNPEHIGYLIRCFVADTEAKAQELGKNFFWQNGALNKQPREWMAPPGYATVNVAGIRRLRAVSRAFDSLAYEEGRRKLSAGGWHAGPGDRETALCPGPARRWPPVPVGPRWLYHHDDTVRCIELFGKEVLPALRAA